jgi:hypothetical protein
MSGVSLPVLRFVYHAMQQKLQLMCTSVVRRNMKPAAILQEMDGIKLRRRFPITFAAWH